MGEQSAGVAPCRTSLAAALTGARTGRDLRLITCLRRLNFLALKSKKQDLNPVFSECVTMLSITLEGEVSANRTITLQLPDSVPLGKHELVVVINEQVEPNSSGIANAQALNQLTGTLRLTEDPVALQRRLREEWE